MGWFRKLLEKRNIGQYIQQWLLGDYIGIPTGAGKNISEYNAMYSTAVYACVRVLSETVASLPFSLYTYTADGKTKARDHPLYRILHDIPNPEMDSFTFRETLMSHLLLWGNAYAQIIRDLSGNVTALWVLTPDRMEVRRNENGNIVYRYTKRDGTTAVFFQHEVLHIRGLGFDGLVGYSPIAMAREAVGLALATEEFGARFFSNGARPGGVLEHPGVVKDPAKVRESWEAVYKGAGNAHKIAVLEEGMKYHEIGIPPEDAQFLETRKFQLNEICRIYRVPPHLVGDLEKATFSNIEHQSIDFVIHSVRPWLVKWEQAVFRCLLTPSEQKKYFARFTVDGLLRGDFKTRQEGYAIGRQNGWYSANDIRELEDLNRISKEEGGDTYLVNGNMLPIKMAGQFYLNKGSENQK